MAAFDAVIAGTLAQGNPAIHYHGGLRDNDPMPLSARNQLSGKIVQLQLGTVMAHVVVQVGENQIESVITKKSAEEMRLRIGDSVTAIIKSTEVMLQKD
jgi:molybdopterin-binding protein